MATPPASRNDFEIAIVCALPLEYDAVCNLVDQFWDDDYGRAAGDPNMYTNGRVGAFNIVIVLLSGMGKVKATSATASLRSSYPNLELALVTGICGGVPITGSGKELVLGDVVISNTVVQYDLGRRYPNEFETKHTLSDSLGRPALHIQNLVVTFKTSRGLQQLEGRAASHLKTLQSRQLDDDEAAKECDGGPSAVCNASRKLSCRELGCDVQQRVSRKRLQDNQRLRVPQVLVGRLGSGDTVLKSGEDRDRIAEEHDLIAFEMEGAGAWDEIPCIIVKGICDYADSHKNKNWQNFAAATAASVAKALVEKYPRTDKPSTSSYTQDRTTKTVSNTNSRTLSSHACRVLAYDRNENFIPRPDINSKLDQLLPFNSDEFHSAALWGLGGSGRGDAQNSVLRTWAISIRRLEQDCQTAYTILHVLAFVDNQNIPVELLAAAAKYKYRQEGQTTKPRQRGQTLKRAVRRLKDFSFRSPSPRPEENVKNDDADDLDELGQAVRRLKNFSFMTEHRGEGNKRTFEMHKLVQDAARYGLKTQQQQSTDQVEVYFAKAALDVVDGVCPQEKWYSNQTRGDCERYLAHTLRHGITLECKRLLAEVQIRQRRPEEAKQLLMEALDEARKFLDEDHESILDCINELARAHMGLKEYDEADKLIPRLLKLRQDKYGQNSPNTLGVHNLLGNLYYEQGRHDEVVQVLSPLLDFKRQLLGDENLSTLVTMNNLALSQRYVRKEEAVKLMQEYSRLCHKAFGADHPRTKAADEQLEEWELEDARPNL
ncbi:hypothetical protein CDV36_015147 [Fusarium kuroshium]|uniref:Nucleoside phosphorylase domain-containing protein n=1 Tax=Fusarium kuroshium TaxID=2010991 RepID=A0A3M2RDD3_9HYPO|nr:hypothetical protein CDV36_015147 [Fusarium kuroshium]